MNADLVVQAIVEIGKADDAALPGALQRLADSLSYEHAAIVQARKKSGAWRPVRTVCQSENFRKACQAVLQVVCESPDPVRLFNTGPEASLTESLVETETNAAAGIHLADLCTDSEKTVLMLVSSKRGVTLTDMEKRLLSTVGTLVAKSVNGKELELDEPPDLNAQMGIVSHDLRNPLASILGYTELLLMSPQSPSPEEQRKALTRIRDSSLFTLQLLSELMESSLIESGRLKLMTHETDVRATLKRSIERCTPQADAKQITIALDVPAEPLPAALDFDHGSRVLDNLITNALKFSKPGTTVMVKAAQVGDQVEIAVTDQGQGIPAEELPKLFKKFSRTSARATAGEKSTGLGLYIVKSLVKLHGGTVRVTSEPGKGSTFTVSLPVSARQ